MDTSSEIDKRTLLCSLSYVVWNHWVTVTTHVSKFRTDRVRPKHRLYANASGELCSRVTRRARGFDVALYETSYAMYVLYVDETSWGGILRRMLCDIDSQG